MGHRQGPAQRRAALLRRRARPGKRPLAHLTQRVALATCSEVPELDEDGPALLEALARLGVEGVPAVWDDPTEDWSAFELVVIRSTWDYAERRDQFLAWVRGLPRVLNDASVVEWSTDKQRYLTALEQAGVPIVPTCFVEPGDLFEPPREPFVVKPSISAGGRSSARFAPDEAEAAGALVRRIHAAGRTAMVQPFVADADETALVYLDGSYSHSVRRHVPLPRASERAVFYLEEEIAPCEPSAAARATAEAALEVAGSGLLYARVDVIGDAVLELEIAEPSLYLGYGEGAAARFAAAIATALSQRRRISAENGPTTSQ